MVFLSEFSLVGMEIRRLSTHCRRDPLTNCHSLKSFVNAFPNRMGLALKPWGSTVQVRWEVLWVSGSVHSKAKR